MLARNRTDGAIARARALRRTMGDSERRLWHLLRAQQTGFRFRRQHPLGPYVLDFYCAQARLCVELDGDSHQGRQQEDTLRDEALAEAGIATVRIWTSELYDNAGGVVERIWRECRQRTNQPTE